MKNIARTFLVLAALTAGTVAYGQINGGRYQSGRPTPGTVYSGRDTRVPRSSYTFGRYSGFGNSGAIRITYGGTTWMAKNFFQHGTAWNGDMEQNWSGYDDSIYYGLVTSTGAFGVGIDLPVDNWLSVTIDCQMAALWHDVYEAGSDYRTGSETGTALYLLPKLKVYYVNTPSMRFYGNIGLGLSKYCNFNELKHEYKDSYGLHFIDKSLKCAFQMAPIGIEVGGQVFGFAELGFGSIFCGVQGGIGWRF